MSRRVKILILILTVLPILLFFGGYIAFFLSFVSSFPSEAFKHTHPTHPPAFPPGPFIAFFVSLMIAYLVSLGMLIFYLANLIMTNRAPKDLKPIWGVLFFVGPLISWLVYWFVYIWPEPATVTEPTISMPPPTEQQTQD